MNIDTSYTIQKINLIIDWNVRAATVKYLEESLGENLCNNGLDNDFLNRRAQAMQEKVKNVLIKIKSFCASKDTIKVRRWDTHGRKYLQIIYLIRI